MAKEIKKNNSKAKLPKINNIGKIGVGTTLEKIMEKDSAVKILAKNGVPCLSCPLASFEIDKLKIGDVCKMYGLNLQKILKELNK
jgi:hypothetical protein